ncbi:MAG: hypothetical protein ACI8Z1_001629 [Candidatus Azotimanducaceae bacterium]|jgi:hypothetical protein
MADTVFTMVNTFVLPFWLLLIVAPHSKATKLLVHSGLVPVLLGSVYLFYIVGAFAFGPADGGNLGSLDGLQQAFSNKETLVGAWVHYLVFDLFVGAWMARDAKRHRIHHFAIVIPLLLTFMAGPFGLLLYVALKGFWIRQFSLLENVAEPAISTH